jgi:protocatechuate 3,4-dioxygenase beta subunit
MTKNRWTRRKFIRNTATAAAGLRLAASVHPLGASIPPVCILSQEQEEGPYYVDHEILRKDITEGRPGIPLRLRLTVIDAERCKPIQNAALDVWHCDASGIYSGFTGFNPTGPGGPERPGKQSGRPPGPPQGSESGGPPPGGAPMGRPPKRQPSDKQIFLRGVQLTDANGIVEFVTIYPGHYMGRVNHIHMKVHIGGAGSGSECQGGHVAHIGQAFFPEEVSELVTTSQPYANHKIHRTTLDEDGVFNGENGAESMAALTPISPNDPTSGYIATLTLVIDPDATPPPTNRRPGGPPPR